MNNWKNYAGSVLLAGLLLQGCSSDSADETTAAKIVEPETQAATTDADIRKVASEFITDASTLDQAQATNGLSLKLASIANEGSLEGDQLKAYAEKVMEDENLQNLMEAYTSIAEAILAINTDSDANRGASRNALKDGLINIFDSKLGGKITGAMFDVVLNSDGVTVVMLDAARASRTTSQIMIDAIGRNPSLLNKMCPMLQDNAEFGEKFTALAYEMYPETKEGAPDMGNFFFSVVNAPLYGCLTDAMLLSNNDAVHHDSVEHSTNGYMGLLMARHAATFFITPGTGTTPATGYGSTDAFANLMFNTGANAEFTPGVDGANGTFTGHGDANELANEQLFYSLFKTPGSTASFIAAMQQLSVETQTMFMDKIFLGAGTYDPVANALVDGEADNVQGYLNIISVGSAMYDGIYGEKNAEGIRDNAYGFDAYLGSFMDFALLIPGNRYFDYGAAFINAGYEFAAYNGINVWSNAYDNATAGAQDIWNGYFAEDNATTADASATAPARSAMQGKYSTNWFADMGDLFYAAVANAWNGDQTDAVEDDSSYWEILVDGTTSAYDWVIDDNTTILGSISSQTDSALAALSARTDIAMNTIIDGRGENNATYPTTVQDSDEVLGFHGLVELAIQEDMVMAQKEEGNTEYTLANAKTEFVLPPFAESLTWSYAYTSASEGATAYYNSTTIAKYIVDFKENDLVDTMLVQNYFYPDANNAYIPNSLLAVDWLRLPETYSDANIQETDFNFDGGYLDIYLVSKNANLEDDLDLEQAAGTTVTKVDMGTDSLIAVDENGQTLDGLYVYKIRVVTPEQTASVFDALAAFGDDLLEMVGLDSDNATQTTGTATEETASAE